MEVKFGLIITLIVILVIGGVNADIPLIPDSITINATPNWVTVPYGSSIVSVHVVNISYNGTNMSPLGNVTVNLTLSDNGMGLLSQYLLKTNSNGDGNATFTSGTHSGDVIINATINSTTTNASYTQHIDHGPPTSFYQINAPGVATAGSTINISAMFVDQYGNIIDGKNIAENVSFRVLYSPSGESVFLPSNSTTTTVLIDQEGLATTSVYMSSKAGSTAIQIWITGVPFEVIWIEGISQTLPYSINIYPERPDPVYANGVDKAELTFTILDQYGSTIPDAEFWVNTTFLGENWLLRSGADGTKTISYGPRTERGNVTITATASQPWLDGQYATSNVVVSFVSDRPVQLVLMASPQDLGSWDLPGNQTSIVSGVVTDELGNGVPNETVRFSIIDQRPYGATQTFEPVWNGNNQKYISSVTNEQGYANVEFRPGYFTGDGYPGASGNALIRANWTKNGTIFQAPSQVGIRWTNSPFLSVNISVIPLQARWNETIEVNLTVIGNGYRLNVSPIDVVLCTDRSGSMLEDNPDRMVYAKSAIKSFNSKMGGNDRVGIVTFGVSGHAYLVPKKSGTRWDWSNLYDGGSVGWWTAKSDGNYECNGYQYDTVRYSTNCAHHIYVTQYYGTGRKDYTSYATTDLGLTFDKSSVNTTVDGIVPTGGTPMREAIYRSVEVIKNSPRPNVVKAIILLTDGNWNTGGDPDGGYGAFHEGSLTSDMSVITYANQSGVKIFTVGLGSDVNQTALSAYANRTGGKFYYAPTGQNLEGIYIQIAGELRENAGVGVVSNMNFQNVNISANSSIWSLNGSSAFQYLPTTEEKMWWFTNGTIIYTNSRDDTSNWSQNSLDFNIGTIKIYQAWNSLFYLMLKPDMNNVGQIELFGNSSLITFNTGDYVVIPTTYLTCIGAQNETDVYWESAAYKNLAFNTTATRLRWDFQREFTRNGNTSTNWYRPWAETATLIISNGILPKRAFSMPVIPANTTAGTGYFEIDINSFIPAYLRSRNFSAFVTFEINGTDKADGGNVLARKTLMNQMFEHEGVPVTPTVAPTAPPPVPIPEEAMVKKAIITLE